MFFSQRRVLAAAALLLCACGRRQPQEIQRLAITRFENLSADTSADWIGRALAEVMTAELAGSRTIYAIPSSRLHSLNAAFGVRPIQAPGISAETPLAQAAGANRMGYGEYSVAGGRLRVRLTIEDPATRSVATGPIEVAVDAGDIVGAATAIARQISPEAKPYGTANAAALEAYVRGLEAGNPADILGFAQKAVAADPNFGPGYVLLVESLVQRQDRAAAGAVLQAAAAHASALDETSRIRLDLVAASLRGDAATVEKAAAALAQSRPLDPAAWKLLGDAAAGRRQYAQTVAAYSRALSTEPGDVSLLNQLGYTAAYAGDLESAMNALRRYQALRPADPNPLDSMGDVNVLVGRLKEAEGLYLEAYKKNASFLNGLDLFKAATARLMTGDVAGADAILGDKARNPQWLWLSGRRSEAFKLLQAETSNPGAPAALAVWAKILKDDPVAAKLAAQAAPLATPANAASIALARFVTLPSAPAAEWSARAEQMFGRVPPLKDAALAYALLLDGHFPEAVPVLQRIEARSGSTGDRSAAIELAWALIETGKLEEAAPLLKLNPVQSADTATVFVGLYFPRLYQLRAIVAERQGKTAEAQENRRIYQALGGR